MGPKLRNSFLKHGSAEFSDQSWLDCICCGSSKMRFEFCENSKNLTVFCAIQGHTGGNLTAPELLGHVVFPHNWKEFILQLYFNPQIRTYRLSIRLRTNQMKNTIEASEKLLTTLSTGSIWPERKTNDYNSGRQGPMRLLSTISCWQIASTK